MSKLTIAQLCRTYDETAKMGETHLKNLDQGEEDLKECRVKIEERVDALRSPEGHEKIMSDRFGGMTDLLPGKLMSVFIGANRELAPGEKAELATLPMTCQVQLDYVMVPDEVTYDQVTKTPRLFFHHDQILEDVWAPGAGRKVPASLILRPEHARVQQLDFYPKRRYEVGEVIVLGVFENVGTSSLYVRAMVAGKAVDRRSELPGRWTR